MCGQSRLLPPTGSNRKRDHRNVRVKKPDYKVAYVQLVSMLAAAGARGRVGAGGPACAVTGSDLSGAGGHVVCAAAAARGPGRP